MCGIYGTTNFRFSDVTVRQKLNRINFRGPDFSSVVKNESVIFGHNRLSILDLDKRSNQPFEYGDLLIVFNGEIYNFQELKVQLKSFGYTFRTNSDTEVICALYLKYGHDCVKHLNGMFAFVIYDKRQNKLFGARDRLGQKPLYYSLENDSFEFASQVSQIAIGNSYEIDETSISQYLLWKYIPEPCSIYKEVRKLKAGYCFIYDLEKHQYNELRYWDIPFKYGDYKGSFESACHDLEVLLQDSVKMRMVSDVPLGVFLSGGIDSSLISALAQKESSSSIRTFSIKFNEQGFDESRYAEEVARVLGTNHLTIPCTYKEGLDLIERHNYYYDEPFSDSSAIPSMLLAKHTKKHVTVALTGDAGDESFLGYTRYKWLLSVSSIYKSPFFLRKNLGRILSNLPHNKASIIGDGLQHLDIESLYIRMMSSLNNHHLINPSLGISETYNSFLYNSKKPLLEKISDFDLKTYLNGDINTKVDRASMAFSLEARSPFLDYRIVEFGRSLPTSFKYSRGNQKVILKQILNKYVPDELFERPKAGFTMPFQKWFRNELREMVLDTLNEDNLKKIPNLNVDFVLKQIQNHMAGKTNFYPTIWSLIILTKWFDGHAK